MAINGTRGSTLSDVLDEPVHPALAGLANFTPGELQQFLETVKESTNDGIQGTLESLTVTVMTSIE